MPETDLTLLTQAAQEAGEIALRYWRQDPQVWHKPNDQGPVTEADLAVDRHLHDLLRAARPDYGWLSEETEDQQDRLDNEYVFIVDPIDGTRAFMNGNETFAHSLAIARNGQVVAGAVFMPALDRMYTAAIGTGAQLNGAQIHVTDQPQTEGANVLAAIPALESRLWTAPHGFVRHTRSSLAYRLCLVAQGRFDAMVTLRDTWHWDIAAGSLIVSEAGGAITDRTGAPLRFNSQTAQSLGTIAAGPALHRATLALLQEPLSPTQTLV